MGFKRAKTLYVSGAGGWPNAMFTGTRIENSYKAIVPLLKHPEPELVGKACDGGGRTYRKWSIVINW